jgi:hypothetical protein
MKCVQIESLSRETGCTILAKAEFSTSVAPWPWPVAVAVSWWRWRDVGPVVCAREQ